MSNQLEYNLACSRSRWLAYFDLLGTRELIRSGDNFRIFSIYERALRAAEHSKLPVHRAWFSDTFLLFSEGGDASDWWYVDSVSRWFVFFLIMAEIPVRGAIAYGDFFADSSSQVYFGKALAEGYEFGEAQDWIGFLLCPSAVARLNELGMPAEQRLNYACEEIPFKKHQPDRSSKLPACILGNWAVSSKGENPLLNVLREMKQKQPEASIARKYENTIAFIKRNPRFVAQADGSNVSPNNASVKSAEKQ